MADQLKNAIKQAADLGDDYEVIVEKYLDANQVALILGATKYKIVKIKDVDAYNVHFYKNNKLLEVRRGKINSTTLQVSREPNKKARSFFNLYLTFSLFGR